MKRNVVNKKNVILILICIALISVLIVYKLTLSSEDDNPDKNIVTVGQVARSIALIGHTSDECKEMENHFLNNSDKWYVPYMNAMYEDTYYLEKKVKPTDSQAVSPFTYSDLDDLLTNIGIADKELWSYVNNNKSSNAIINGEWNKIYEKIVKLLDKSENIKEVELCVVGTVSNVPALESWKTVTTLGTYTFTGLSIDYYIDKKVSALVKDDELLCVKEVLSTDVTYENAWVITVENGIIKAYVEGAVRQFEIDDKEIIYSSVIADISLSKRKVKQYVINSTTVSGKVMVSGSDGIELEGDIFYDLDTNVKVYKTYGSMEMKTIKDILVGYDAQKFILNDEGKICAAIIDRDVNAKNIRVLIKTTGFSDIVHDSVTISSEGVYQLSYGNETKMVDGGSELIINPGSEYLENGRLIITPQSVNGRISINSIERAYGNPSYRGTIELSVMNGKIVIVNELPVEQYLYGVVPSEMPYTYDEEALKSQAICARSYAYKQILANSYSEYGAHVDDSTSFQVYNNIEEKASTSTAVDETYGQVLMYGDQIVTAYFFSTSCGSTTDNTIWSATKLPYIEGKMLTDDGADIDLTNEMNFDTFIRSQYSSYDSAYPWYRWTFEMPLDDITETVNANIGRLYETNNKKILTMVEEDVYVSQPIKTVGEVKRIAIGTRGVGGVLQYIVIFGTEATVKVESEYYIRQLFYPVSTSIVLNDGSQNSNFPLLPSGYFVLDPVIKDGIIAGYTFVGGGYGHGVGFSQNGANTMGNNGKTYEEILKFFYADVDIEKIY